MSFVLKSGLDAVLDTPSTHDYYKISATAGQPLL